MHKDRSSHLGRTAPALTLAFLAPMFAEVLPGATRFSAIFVFPIEMAVWGGGAVMARALVRWRGLGWWSLLLLGLALSIAEEFLIQQTSVAPMVIRLKGETWARAFGINYVYLLWALVYESLWVVVLPTLAAEILFERRRREPWLNKAGAGVTAMLFLTGAFFAWFTWTQIARTKVFHQPAFTPPLHLVLIASFSILLLIVAALRLPKRMSGQTAKAPMPFLLAMLSGAWAILWFGLVVLAFGIAPYVPPSAAIAAALLIILLLVLFVPRWAADPRWERRHDYALLAGALCGSMGVSFIAFIGAAPMDLWFKIITDAAALASLVLVYRNLFWKRPSIKQS
jgi:hypothetical protein